MCWSLEQPLLCPGDCAAAGAGMGRAWGRCCCWCPETEKCGLYSFCWELGPSFFWGRATASCVTLQLSLLLCFPLFLRTCPRQQCMQLSALPRGHLALPHPSRTPPPSTMSPHWSFNSFGDITHHYSPDLIRAQKLCEKCGSEKKLAFLFSTSKQHHLAAVTWWHLCLHQAFSGCFSHLVPCSPTTSTG